MAIFSEVNAQRPEKQKADERKDLKVRIYFGVFFDGTSNNMIERSKALAFRKKHSTGPFRLFNHHAYERIELDQNDAVDLDLQKNDGYYKKGFEFKGFSNIAIMHSKYQGIEPEKLNEEGYLTKVYKIYVEGSGANDINGDKLIIENGMPIIGLGFGVGKTGVVALVSKAIVAVDSILKTFNQSETIELHFDVFGFSRGSACARLFSYLVIRKEDNPLKREGEFGSHTAKGLYDGKRLIFLKDYEYGEPKVGKKTKKVDFLGIFDTVASMGVLRREKENVKDFDLLDTLATSVGWNKDDTGFFSKKYKTNPLRAGMVTPDFHGNWHDLNAKEYGLFPSSRGVNTFHICALDEFRENFALVDIGQEVPDGCLELFLPGCHSDIGGGYICGDSTRCVINIEASIFAADTEKKNKDKLYLITDKPQELKYVKEKLSLSALMKLGWIPVCEVNENNIGGEHLVATTTLAADNAHIQGKHTMAESLQTTKRGKIVKNDGGAKAEFEFWEDDKRVGFKRTTPSFFSNLPLRLMVERAKIQVNRSLFMPELDVTDGNSGNTSFYDVPSGLKEFYKEVRAKVIDANDKRMFVMPGNQYASETYKIFRMNYLHFTSEQNWGYSRLWNVPNAHNHVMCRIVYHGAEGDPPKLHYMQEYNQPCS